MVCATYVNNVTYICPKLWGTSFPVSVSASVQLWPIASGIGCHHGISVTLGSTLLLQFQNGYPTTTCHFLVSPGEDQEEGKIHKQKSTYAQFRHQNSHTDLIRLGHFLELLLSIRVILVHVWVILLCQLHTRTAV